VVAKPRSFVLPNGRFDLPRMLQEFAAFWREHGDVLAANQPYAEVASQLVLMAYRGTLNAFMRQTMARQMTPRTRDDSGAGDTPKSK
jgi:hypothetical protein